MTTDERIKQLEAAHQALLPPVPRAVRAHPQTHIAHAQNPINASFHGFLNRARAADAAGNTQARDILLGAAEAQTKYLSEIVGEHA